MKTEIMSQGSDIYSVWWMISSEAIIPQITKMIREMEHEKLDFLAEYSSHTKKTFANEKNKINNFYILPIFYIPIGIWG